MCILSFIPASAELSTVVLDDLYTGGLHNPDGHGWALARPGVGIVMQRTLNLGEALDGIADARKRYPDTDAMFHSRWATHGDKTVGNCHPFIVGSDYRTVLAHNGVLRNALPAPGDPRSDTGVFASDVMPRQFRRLDKPSVQNALDNFIGSGNKIVILTANPRYRRTSYLVGEKRGEWCESTGVWHSNSDYRWYRPWPKGEAAEIVVEPTVVSDDCVMCDGHVNAIQLCVDCGTCQDCLEPSSVCLCFVRKQDALTVFTAN